MELLFSLALSLVLTLVLESGFALLWGAKGRDMGLVLLVNALTNPVVVLCYRAAAVWTPGLLLVVTVVMELGAVAVEGWLFRERSGIPFPWAFSLCANLFSFILGLMV